MVRTQSLMLSASGINAMFFWLKWFVRCRNGGPNSFTGAYLFSTELFLAELGFYCLITLLWYFDSQMWRLRINYHFKGNPAFFTWSLILQMHFCGFHWWLICEASSEWHFSSDFVKFRFFELILKCCNDEDAGSCLQLEMHGPN